MSSEALEIIRAIAILMVGIPLCIVSAVLVVGIFTFAWILIEEIFYWLKEILT